jgi:DNA-binding XRE family transcriptional regulator
MAKTITKRHATIEVGGSVKIEVASIVVLEGKPYAIMPAESYNMLRAVAGLAEKDLPALPKPDAKGRVDALAYSRASLARKIITARKAKGWTQKQLADAAGVRIETINRIEKGHNTPDVATVDKIQAALDKA